MKVMCKIFGHAWQEKWHACYGKRRVWWECRICGKTTNSNPYQNIKTPHP